METWGNTEYDRNLEGLRGKELRLRPGMSLRLIS
jgi:hypothetical protein